MKICEKRKVYFLVHKIKTEKRTNNWIFSTKKCTGCLHSA